MKYIYKRENGGYLAAIVVTLICIMHCIITWNISFKALKIFYVFIAITCSMISFVCFPKETRKWRKHADEMVSEGTCYKADFVTQRRSVRRYRDLDGDRHKQTTYYLFVRYADKDGNVYEIETPDLDFPIFRVEEHEVLVYVKDAEEYVYVGEV